MMSKELHNKATEILGRVIDLPYRKAIDVIEKECGENTELKSAVLELYNEINAEEKRVTEKETRAKESKISRIGAPLQKTRVVGQWTKLLFLKKRSRLISMLTLFLLLLVLGWFLRSEVKSRIILTEQQEFKALIETQAASLIQWIEHQKTLTDALAESELIVTLTESLDKLNQETENKSTADTNTTFESVYAELNQIRNNLKLEALGIVHKNDPIYLILTEVAGDGSDNIFSDVQIGKTMYEFYLKMKEGNSVYVPPLHDSERFLELPENLNIGTYTTFSSPIKKEGEIIGFLFNEFNAENTFSEVLNIAKHGNTAELYAFDKKGKMISRSRFQHELQNTYLLDYDSTKSSIFNITLKDPGQNILIYDEPVIEPLNQDYTQIFSDASIHLNKSDSVFSGVITKPYRNYMGKKVVGSWRWMSDYGFGIIAEENEKDAFKAFRYFDISIGLFYFILAILVLALYNINSRVVQYGQKIEDLQSFGQYRIQNKLGEGGFGVVYKAEHALLKTPVAIKQLKKEFVGTDLLDRFEKEVKVTASLSHPNTIRVYDYGKTEDQQFYYVMEFLNGLSLEEVLDKSEQIPVGRVVHVLLHTCYSLQEAHAHGLIHRDIKPQNVMLCNQGGAFDHVKVLDFGLVKNVDTSVSQQTQIDRIGGTPMFMAPERIRDPFNTDQKVDIYSVGAMGLYALSGSYVVELLSTKMMSGMDTITGDLEKALVKRDDVSEGLEKLFLECVHFDPAKRPENIEQVILQLEKLRKWHPWTREDAKEWWKSYDGYGNLFTK